MKSLRLAIALITAAVIAGCALGLLSGWQWKLYLPLSAGAGVLISVYAIAIRGHARWLDSHCKCNH
jgi:DNA-binding transcriptional regulator of glucitol operon